MKKTIYLLLISLLAMTAQAQQVDRKGLQRFIDELKSLKNEHVECESENFAPAAHFEYPKELVVFKLNDQDVHLSGGITTSDTTFRYLLSTSEDEIGYHLIHGVLDKYYDLESECIFEIPLLASQREGGEEQTIFMSEGNTLIISDDIPNKEIEIIYADFNLMNTIQNRLNSLMGITNNSYVDVNVFGGIDFSVHLDNVPPKANSTDKPYLTPGASCDEIMARARRIYDDNTLLLKNRLTKAESEEQREEIKSMIKEFEEEKEKGLADLEKELAELDRPSFIEIIPGSGEHYVAIPKVDENLEEKLKPYAAYGVYDWINLTCFRNGAKWDKTDQISCIITPQDVAKQYVIRNYTRDKWFDDGFTAEYKTSAAIEYQGGTPAVLYSFSQTEKGYNEMISQLSNFFKRKLGEKEFGLEVTQTCELNGKRFVQLWGEGGILMCILDSPADKHCHMSIIIGGVSGFEQAVNEYVFGDEKDFAKKCNIIIDSDLSDNSYGIHFTTDEYFYAGKSHTNGVHIDFRYAKILTE